METPPGRQVREEVDEVLLTKTRMNEKCHVSRNT